MGAGWPERVIAYYRKTVNNAERNYCISWRELLVIVRTLEHFNEYLYGQEFHMCTDHSTRARFMGFKKLEVQAAYWIQHLQE
jgi:hypothetical protein